MELRKVINGSDAGTIGTFARIGWHQLPVRAVPAIGIFSNSVGTFFALQAIAFSSFIDQLHIIFIQPVFTFLQYFQDRWHTQIELIRQLLGGDLLPWPEMKEYF